MRECELTPEAGRDPCQSSKLNRHSWRVYPRTAGPDYSSNTSIRSWSPHTHSQSHWNVIISFSLYVHWHALTGWKLLPFQTGSGRWVPQQKLNYFYCRTARRGKTTCKGWKSKLRRGKGQPLLTNVSLMHSYGRSCCGMRTYTTSQ